jgi:LysR family cys regulon transcriptional activator
MELAQLSSFSQIAKTGSFSEAAKRVFLSQSAVSHQIINLEKELGVKLFGRLGKRIKVTPQGEILLEITNRVFKDLEDLKKIYSDMDQCMTGKLSIAATSSVISYVLPRIIKKFIDRFPKISLKLLNCMSISELLSLVSDGEVDFGIGVKLLGVYPHQINFVAWKSFDLNLIVCKGHPLSERRTIGLVDIVKYPHILFGRGRMTRKIIDEVYARNGVAYNVTMEVDMAENCKIYVEMGIGVGIISSLAITPKDKERLKIINVSNLFGKVEFGIYYRKDKYISMGMKQFIRLFDPKLLRGL